MAISGIGAFDRIGSLTPTPRTGAAATGFDSLLTDALNAIEAKTETANTAVAGMLNQTVDVHEAMLAMHEAEESLEISVAIRNKLMQAYQDIMKMGL